VVYEAQQLSLGRHVALEVLPPRALFDPRQLGRCRREAGAAAKGAPGLKFVVSYGYSVAYGPRRCWCR
jgi:hypothetical protein